MIESLKALWLIIGVTVRTGPAQCVVSSLETLGRIFAVLQPLYMAWFVTGVVRHDLRRTVLASIAFVVSLALYSVLIMLGTNARVSHSERVGFEFDRRVAASAAAVPTLDHLESPKYLNELQTLQDQRGALGRAFSDLLDTINFLAFVVGTIVLAVGADWRLLLVAVAGAPTVFAGRWAGRRQAEAEDAAAEASRLSGHLLSLGLSPRPGAEIRVFGTTGLMRRRLTDAVHAWRTPFVRAGRYRAGAEGLSLLAFFGTAAGVLAWMISDVATGDVSLTAMVLAILLIGRLQHTSLILSMSIANSSRLSRTLRRFVWVIDYGERRRAEHAGTQPPPECLHDGITLKSVSYRYNGAERATVQDISLTLPAGKVIALVGENGAGKSTLVKLLTGLYKPSAGSIRVDGVDLSTLDHQAWRRSTSGAFQDYVAFEFRARESIGVGDVEHTDDDQLIRRAMTAGIATDVIAALPEELDTKLGGSWPGGVELSSGQWQRVALARGMMRDVPLLLILDEPTSALDAATEHALFERYAQAAHRSRSRGGVTVLVTHRFSTVSAADLIAVLHEGRVVEFGTHEQLIQHRGQYADLYDLQANAYR